MSSRRPVPPSFVATGRCLRSTPPAAALVTALALAFVAPRPDAADRAAAQAPTPTPAVSAERPVGLAYLPLALRGWALDSASLGDPGAPGLGYPGIDIDRYDVNLTFAIERGVDGDPPRVDYTAITTLVGHGNLERVERIALDFVLPGGPVEVLLDDAPARWWSGPGNKLWVALPRPLGVGTPFKLRFHYGGSARANGSGLLVRRAGETLQIWSAVGGAVNWFPGNHHPRDRAEIGLTLTAPDPYVTVGNGGLVRQFRDGDRVTTAFYSRQPMATSEVMVHIAPYTVVERGSPGGIPFRAYLLRAPEAAEPTLAALARQLDWYAARLLGYPFEALTIVESGAANSTSLAGLFVVGRNQAGARTVYWERNAALMARQWFGAAVGVRNRGDDWLNTGLATYLAQLYLARDQGPEVVRARMAAFELSYASGVAADVALAELPGDGSASTQAVAANKAPFAFHRLRLLLGDRLFWAVLGDYIETTPELLASLNALEAAAIDGVTGPTGPVRALFDGDFRAARVPRLLLAWSRAGGALQARACQLTAAPAAFALPLALHGDAGVAAAELRVTAADEVLALSYAGRLEAITPDPRQELLADVVVHPVGDAPLPACEALPRPAIATGGGVAAGAAGAAMDTGGPVDGAVGVEGKALDGAGGGGAWDEAGAADGGIGIPAAERARHLRRHAAAVPEAAAMAAAGARPPARSAGAAEAPAPSIGDPYLPYLGNTGYDVVTYTVRARIDPVARRIDAETTIEATSTISGLASLSFDFMRLSDDGATGLTVTSVEVDGAAATFERPADAHKLWVDLPRVVGMGEPFAVRVRYDGVPRPGGQDVFSGGLLPHGQQTMYAISEPDGTRNWIPCNDHPRDKARWRFEITVPAPFVATANGVLVEERPGAAETTVVYEMRQPMATYLAGVAVGRYRTAEQTGPGGVPIRHFVLNDPAAALRVADVTPDILAVFGRQVAPYPFDSYGHFAAPDFGGGMENQSMTAIGANVFATRTPRGSHSLIAHEAAHQWFGDAISPYSWADIWLNEDFATYFAELWRVDRVGPELLGWRMDALRYTVLNSGVAAPVSQPVLADMFGANTYEKGGWVLHMLRGRLGEPAFWEAVRSYYTAHRYGNARTDDLEAAMAAAGAAATGGVGDVVGDGVGDGVGGEAATDEVGGFFDQWVHRAGNPVLYAAWSQHGDRVAVRLCQGEPAFDLPVVVAVDVEGGAGERGNAMLTGALADVEVMVKGGAAGVTVDPDASLLAEVRVARVADSRAMACDAIAAAWQTGGTR